AHRSGQENLQKPAIKAAIQAALDARSARMDITVDQVIEELAKMAFQDMRERLPQRTGSPISRFRPGDKIRALELLGRHLGMFTQRRVVDANVQVTEIRRTIVYPDKPPAQLVG
ncbi:MAG: hypothetical protein DRR42_22640, partial [Gammaproteobacteria bacterium]